MKVKFTDDFSQLLARNVLYISWDKPEAAKKIRKDLIKNLKKDLKFPYHFKKSIYFDNELIRDYVFKGYTSVYKINEIEQTVEIFGFIKYIEKLTTNERN